MTDDLAQRVRALEVQLESFAGEQKRSRERLHTLENTTAALVQTARANREAEERRNRERIEAENERAQRFGRRISLLSLLVAVAAVLVPITSLLLHFA